MIKLQVLNLAGNEIEELPKSLIKMKSLQELNILGNSIKSFPELIRTLEQRGVRIYY